MAVRRENQRCRSRWEKIRERSYVSRRKSENQREGEPGVEREKEKTGKMRREGEWMSLVTYYGLL